MCSFTTCLILTMLGIAPTAAKEQSLRFQEKVYDDPQPSDLFLKNVWPGLTEQLTNHVRAIVPSYPAAGHYAKNSFWTATFEIDKLKVLLSIVDHPAAGCAGSGAHHDMQPHPLYCPARLTIIHNGRYVSTIDIGLVCLYRNDTFVSYDDTARKFHIYAQVNGQTPADCSKTVPMSLGAAQ